MSAAVNRVTRQMYGQCFRKLYYAEQWVASAVVKRMKARGRVDVASYRCSHGCGGWHIGSDAKRRQGDRQNTKGKKS